MKLDLNHLSKVFWIQVLYLTALVFFFAGYLFVSGAYTIEASETILNQIIFYLFLVLLIAGPLFINLYKAYYYSKKEEKLKSRSHLVSLLLIALIIVIILNN